MNTNERKVAVSVHAVAIAAVPRRHTRPEVDRTAVEVELASMDMHQIWVFRRRRQVFSIQHPVSVL